MSRILFPLYGVAAYLIFVATFLYSIGFVENWHFHVTGDLYFVSKGIDFGGTQSSTAAALAVNLALLALFGVQHSGMARRAFKALWTRVFVPKPIERATYVLASSACLMAMFALWRPMTDVVWAVENEVLAKAIVGLSLVGWGVLFVSTHLINHYELFGLSQVFQHARGTAPQPMKFKTPGFYKLVRHPLYLGFIIAFWATPVMTVGHLLFSAGMLAYILIGIHFEERDLIRQFGDEYILYKDRVRGLVPVPKSKQ